MDVGGEFSIESLNVCGTDPNKTDLGIEHRIEPGSGPSSESSSESSSRPGQDLVPVHNPVTSSMTPMSLRISAVSIILYQLVVLKYFPFISKEKFVNTVLKYIGPTYAHVATIVSIQVVFRTLLIVMFEQIYKFRYFDRYKAIPSKQWLFIEDPKKYDDLRTETYKDYFTKLVPLTLCLVAFLKYGKKSRLDTRFPSVFEMMYQINGSLLITDFMFYLAHRFFFHSKRFYYLHKDHHAYNNPTVHASMKMTFIDYLVEVLIPGSIGPRIFDMHIFTHILYLITGNVIGIMSHSGYIFPFKPISMQFPFNELLGFSNNKHHEIHHNTFNNNFSALSIIPDWLFGTILYDRKQHKKLTDKDSEDKNDLDE